MIKNKQMTNIPYLLAFIIVCFIVLPLGLALTWYEYREARSNMTLREQDILDSMKSEVQLVLENNFALIEFYQQKAEARIEAEVKDNARNMQKIIEDILWKEKRLGMDYTKRMLKKILGPMRFSKGRGVFFAFSPDGTAHILPLNPDYEGTNLLAGPHPQAREAVSDMIRLVNEKGSGIYRYRSRAMFPGPEGRFTHFIAYVKKIPNFNWIIGATQPIEADGRNMYLDIVQHIRFHKSDFNFIINEYGRIDLRFFKDRTNQSETGELVRLIEEQALTTNDCFHLKTGTHPYLICYRYFDSWDWVVGFGTDTTHIEELIEKGKKELRYRLKVEFFYFALIIGVVVVTVLLIGRRFKATIEEGFSVFELFFKNASQESRYIDVKALGVNEFEKLAVVANEMVDKLRQKEETILEYTEKLEQANKKLETLASRDGLTGVYNRRFFDEALERELSRSKRDRTPISLCMIDIDFFKSYNDTYGHQKGDICLKQVAGLLNGLCRRPGDLFARFGGEEFAVVLPGTDEKGLAGMAAAMQDAVFRLRIPHRGSNVADHVTFSMGGISMVPDRHTRSADLVEKADKALYQAKQEGRNRFMIIKG